MNPSAVLVRLYKEQNEWKAMDTEFPEIKWTLYGIKLCINHVKAIIKEQRSNVRLKCPKVDHQHATSLYRACKGALQRLKLSHRKAAIVTLTRAIEKTPIGFHGR